MGFGAFLKSIGNKLNLPGIDGPPVSASDRGVIYYDLSEQKWKYSANGSAYADLVSAGGAGAVANIVNDATEESTTSASFATIKSETIPANSIPVGGYLDIKIIFANTGVLDGGARIRVSLNGVYLDHHSFTGGDEPVTIDNVSHYVLRVDRLSATTFLSDGYVAQGGGTAAADSLVTRASNVDPVSGLDWTAGQTLLVEGLRVGATDECTVYLFRVDGVS